jgi:hypothetical protein
MILCTYTYGNISKVLVKSNKATIYQSRIHMLTASVGLCSQVRCSRVETSCMSRGSGEISGDPADVVSRASHCQLFRAVNCGIAPRFLTYNHQRSGWLT